MVKSTKQPRDKSNPIAKDLRTPKYRQRIEQDRTKHDRGNDSDAINSGLKEYDDENTLQSGP